MNGSLVAVCGWSAAAIAALIAVLTRGAGRARMEAVVRACHELRGPITAARLGIQLAIGGGELTEAGLRAVDLELERAALALDDLSSARARPRAGEWLDVGQLMEDVAEGWRMRAAARGVDLRVQWSGGPAQMWADRARIAQALGNLVANGVEHGGKRVEVRGRLLDGGVRLEVIDDGRGLAAPVAVLARRARGGRGARGRGLAIALAIATSHGGRLSAAPSEQGARLVLELPAALATRPAVAPPGCG